MTMRTQRTWTRIGLAVLAYVGTAVAGCTTAEGGARVAVRPPAQGEARAAAEAVAVAPAQPAEREATVGVKDLEQRVAAAFPGWRLSTEAEILRRTADAAQGNNPAELWGESVRSGEVWWVWPGDFDGDGKQDVATILSNRSDASQDKVVALHGNGTHADVTELGGYGLRTLRKGEEWWGTKLPRDGIVIEIWERSADAYMWDPDRRAYGPVEGTEERCC